MDKPWEQLYHLQDEVLEEIREVRAGLYLTGGTALSRGYYQHRDSEDLDFFLNGFRSGLEGLVRKIVE